VGSRSVPVDVGVELPLVDTERPRFVATDADRGDLAPLDLAVDGVAVQAETPCDLRDRQQRRACCRSSRHLPLTIGAWATGHPPPRLTRQPVGDYRSRFPNLTHALGFTNASAAARSLHSPKLRASGDHYVYALNDYREVDRSIALARL
jgi:hypothetical protein